MNADELIAQLQALSPEDRTLPIAVYDNDNEFVPIENVEVLFVKNSYNAKPHAEPDDPDYRGKYEDQMIVNLVW